MGVAAPIVGLGLSAVGTVASMNSQRQQARQQNEQLTAQALQAEEQLKLAQEHWQSGKQAAQMLRDRELQINQAQTRAAQMQLTEQFLQSKLAATQSRLEAGSMKTNAKTAATQMLTGARNNQAQLEAANVNEQEQVAGALEDLNAQQGGGSLANEQNVMLAGAGAIGRLTQNQQIRTGQAQQGVQYARDTGNNQVAQATTGAGYINQTQRLQNRANNIGQRIGKRLINVESRRNVNAIGAQASSREALGNMQLLQQTIATGAQLDQIAAQRRSITAPGFLSYATALGGIGAQAYQMGLFNRPGGGGQQQQQQSFGTMGSSDLDRLSGAYVIPSPAQFNTPNGGYVLPSPANANYITPSPARF